MNATWTPTSAALPNPNQVVDWIAPDGEQVNGGMYGSQLWFLPPEHSVYCYYTPTYWRPAVKEPAK